MGKNQRQTFQGIQKDSGGESSSFSTSRLNTPQRIGSAFSETSESSETSVSSESIEVLKAVKKLMCSKQTCQAS